MIALDHVDKYLLFRRVQINMDDILKDVHTLYVLTILRHVNKGCSSLGISFHLRKIRRATAINIIHSCLYSLITAGYASRSSGKGSLYYITEQGRQALKDFSDAIECADYVNYNKKAPISKKVKRPGL